MSQDFIFRTEIIPFSPFFLKYYQEKGCKAITAPHPFLMNSVKNKIFI